MGVALASLDDFMHDVRAGDAPPLVRRIAFAQDSAPVPAGGLQVQFARLEIVLGGLYRNLLCDAEGWVGTHALSPGEALFVAANCWNQPAWDADVRLLSLLFGDKHLGLSLLTWNAAEGAFGSVEKRSCPVPGNSPLYQMIGALSGLRHEAAEACTLPLVEAVVEYARALIVRTAAAEERRSAALHNAVRLYLQENLAAGITRERVARQFGVSPNYLSRVFRDQGGTTFSEFLTACRIGNARRLLEAGDMALAEVALRCGFRDVNYFLKVFKKRMGRTPTEYRASIRAGGTATGPRTP